MIEEKLIKLQKVLINKVKALDRRDLSIILINHLKLNDSFKQKGKFIPPWYVLYLLKLTIQYSGFFPFKVITKKKLNELLCIIHEMNNFFDDRLKEDDLLGYIIISSHLNQQRLYQEEISYVHFGIISLLLENILIKLIRKLGFVKILE